MATTGLTTQQERTAPPVPVGGTLAEGTSLAVARADHQHGTVSALTSATANPAATGVVRLAKTDAVAFRNNANSADLPLGINGTDQLTFNGSVVGGGSTVLTGAAYANQGTVNTVLHGNAAGNLSFGAVALGSDVSGSLPIGSVAGPASAGVVTNSGAGVLAPLAGTATTVLHGNAAGLPTFGAVALGTDVSGTLPTANGGTGVTTSSPFCAATTTVAQSIAGGGGLTTIIWGTIETDTDSAMNTSTGVYTVPSGKGGHYIISAAWLTTTSFGVMRISVTINGTEKKRVTCAENSGGSAPHITVAISLNAGDTIAVSASTTQGGAQLLSGNAYENWVSIKRIY